MSSALEEYARIVVRQDANLLKERDKNSLEKCALMKNVSIDLTIGKLLKCAYYIGKEDLTFRKMESLLRELRECGVECLPQLYNDNKACASSILYISKALEAEIYDNLRKFSLWFGLMVDEATDVSVIKNFILYATFVERRQVRNSYFFGYLKWRWYDKYNNRMHFGIVKKNEIWT